MSHLFRFRLFQHLVVTRAFMVKPTSLVSDKLHRSKHAPNSRPTLDLLAAEGECSSSDTLPILLWRRWAVTSGSRAVGFRAC